VLWDYHVILLDTDNIYDFDSTLPFPCPAVEYVRQSFHPELLLREDFRRYPAPPRAKVNVSLCRLIPGEEYIEKFASSRRHMLRENGEWVAEPPTWAVINKGKEDTLEKYIDMADKEFGIIVTEEEFFKKVGVEETQVSPPPSRVHDVDSSPSG
jgi:protein N-terminal glutamine amidohydrolase